MCERSQTCAQAEVWCTATPTVAAADTWKNIDKSEPEAVFFNSAVFVCWFVFRAFMASAHL